MGRRLLAQKKTPAPMAPVSAHLNLRKQSGWHRTLHSARGFFAGNMNLLIAAFRREVEYEQEIADCHRHRDASSDFQRLLAAVDVCLFDDWSILGGVRLGTELRFVEDRKS